MASSLEERTIAGLHEALMPHLGALGLGPEAPILDIGCGSGAWLARLQAAGLYNLFGLDRSVPDVLLPEGHFLQCDLDRSDPPFAELRFELITAIEVIEHVENPTRLFRTAHAILAGGGAMLVTTPNLYSLRSRLRFLFRAAIPAFEEESSKVTIDLEHLHPTVLGAWRRRMFSPIGFDLERIWTYPERHGHGSRAIANAAIAVLGWAFPDRLPGDNLCLLLRKH
jgi:SAM-dependent methyltransferase